MLRALLVVSLPALAGPALADSVLARAEQALVKVPVRGDEAFLIGQARQMRGLPPLFLRPFGDYVKRRSEFPYSMEYELWVMKDKPVALKAPLFPLQELPLAEPSRARALRAAGKDYMPLYFQQSRGVAAVMKKALECKPSFKAPDFGQAGFEYVSTHQVGAVVLAWRRGCMSTEAFKRAAAPYLARVRSEYLATREESLTDLQVERMAMLCLAGHCGRVLPADIARLRSSQAPDGLWHLPDNVREIARHPPHASALAYFVLSTHGIAR